MPWTEPLASSDELRRCIRDLIALSALPAGWQNYDMRQIGGSIVAALVSMLDTDFVFIALPDQGDQIITELARGSLGGRMPPEDRKYAGDIVDATVAESQPELVVHPVLE